MSRLVAILVALGLLAGCGGSPSATPSPSPSGGPYSDRTVTARPDPMPAGVGLSFVQQRFDEGSRRAGVRVSNGDDESLRVVSVGVDWAGFPLRRQRAAYDVPGRSVVDLRYRLPRARCAPSAAAAPATGVAVVRQAGRLRTLRRPVDAAGRRFLERLWRSDCDARALRRAVSVSYADRWTRDPAAGDGLVRGAGRGAGAGAPVGCRDRPRRPGAGLGADGPRPARPGHAVRRRRTASRCRSGCAPAGATSTAAARARRPSCGGSGSSSATPRPAPASWCPPPPSRTASSPSWTPRAASRAGRAAENPM